MAGILNTWEDDVRGIVIGPFLRRYGFFKDNIQICDRFYHFKNDEQAVEFIKTEYPTEFKAGCEMRCYNN